jgi:hypothetical protein
VYLGKPLLLVRLCQAGWYLYFYFYKFSDVAEGAIIRKTILPDLAIV